MATTNFLESLEQCLTDSSNSCFPPVHCSKNPQNTGNEDDKDMRDNARQDSSCFKMASRLAVGIAIESLLEHEVEEISSDGQEKYVPWVYGSERIIFFEAFRTLKWLDMSWVLMGIAWWPCTKTRNIGTKPPKPSKHRNEAKGTIETPKRNRNFRIQGHDCVTWN